MKTIKATVLLYKDGFIAKNQIPFDLLLEYENEIMGEIYYKCDPVINIIGVCCFDSVMLKIGDVVMLLKSYNGNGSNGEIVTIEFSKPENYKITAVQYACP